ncbi:MAG: PAS domain-containing protein [Sphingobacteriaceae bacterium]|nr:PAS domain-containing protein [Cytophagaceae bacterium]
MRSLLDALPDGVVWMEAMRDSQGQLVDFQIQYSNKRAQEGTEGIYRVDAGTRVLGDTQNEEPVRKKTFGELAEVLKTGVTTEFEYFNPRLNRWLQINHSPLDDGVLIVARDQTRQREAEQQRAGQDRVFNGVVNASLNGIITYTAVRAERSGRLVDFRAQTINRVAAAILRLPDQQPGWLLLERFPGVKDRGMFDRYAEVVESGEPLRFETLYEDDGVNGWFDVAVVKLEDGFVITFSDITEQKRTEELAREQARLFDGVLNGLTAGLNVIEAVRDETGNLADLRYLRVSRSVVEDTGLSEEELRGNSMLTLFPAVKNTEYWPAYERALATGEPQRFEVHYTHGGYDNYLDNVISRLDSTRLVSTYHIINDTKRAARAVEQQRNLLEGVLNTSLNGTIVYEAIRNGQHEITDFRFRLFNETARQDILRRTGRDIAGSTLLSVYPNSHKTGAFNLYARVTETARPERFEQNYPDLGVWYDVSLTKLDDGCVVTFIDITQSKQAQQALERSAAELQAVIDTAQTGIFLFSPIRNEAGEITDFRFRTANRMLAAYVGQDPTTVQGALGSAWFPDYQTNGLFERYRQTYLTGETLRFDFHYDGSGIDVWLDIMATKLGDEVLVTFADYTPLKNAQLQVARQAGLLSSILDGSLNGIMAYQARRDNRGEIRDFEVISANRAAELLLGISADDLIGNTLLDLFPEERDLGLFSCYVETVETGLACRTEARYEEHGAEQWLAISASKLDDGFVVTFSDITEQKHAAARDLLYQQKLQRSNEELERFAYVASHDLQEPLRKINSFGDMLLKRHAATLPAAAADKVGRMQAAAGRMQDLIRDLLTYSRVSSQREAFQMVDLNALLKAVRSDLEVTIREKAARLRLDPMPFVPGDALQLQQLFQNLLSNALKFSKPGEVPFVDVRYRSVPGTEVPASVALPTEGRYHEISVSDNGIGFEATYAERIFEAFQRLHGRGEYAGTGIGLAIVKKVVENHRGGIVVSSEPGQGATFWVYLPTGEEIG